MPFPEPSNHTFPHFRSVFFGVDALSKWLYMHFFYQLPYSLEPHILDIYHRCEGQRRRSFDSIVKESFSKEWFPNSERDWVAPRSTKFEHLIYNLFSTLCLWMAQLPEACVDGRLGRPRGGSRDPRNFPIGHNLHNDIECHCSNISPISLVFEI